MKFTIVKCRQPANRSESALYGLLTSHVIGLNNPSTVAVLGPQTISDAANGARSYCQDILARRKKDKREALCEFEVELRGSRVVILNRWNRTDILAIIDGHE